MARGPRGPWRRAATASTAAVAKRARERDACAMDGEACPGGSCCQVATLVQRQCDVYASLERARHHSDSLFSGFCRTETCSGSSTGTSKTPATTTRSVLCLCACGPEKRARRCAHRRNAQGVRDKGTWRKRERRMWHTLCVYHIGFVCARAVCCPTVASAICRPHPVITALDPWLEWRRSVSARLTVALQSTQASPVCPSQPGQQGRAFARDTSFYGQALGPRADKVPGSVWAAGESV